MTLVIAHRTCPRDAAENSMRGIEIAAAKGADMVEVDVRRTRDGVPVLLHDPLLLRTSGWPLPVRWLPSAAVTRLHLRGGSDDRVPTLAQALASLPSGLGMAIDVKDPGAMPATIEVVQQTDCLDRVLLWSQHPRAVEDARSLAPSAEVALLRDTSSDAETHRYLDDTVALGARAVSLHESVATAPVVDDARRRGLRVYCWVQDAARLAAILATNLDGVVTDWPIAVREAMGA